ncbi:hypothetical protein H4582DRAFT_1270221 [Lactarius indigo]|nr:hypothetical protein H4582DRAFT_1270221 [Lactarius indigo]
MSSSAQRLLVLSLRLFAFDTTCPHLGARSPFTSRSPGAAAAAARATQYLFHYWTLSLFASALARNSDSRRSENGHVGRIVELHLPSLRTGSSRGCPSAAEERDEPAPAPLPTEWPNYY